MSAQWDFIERAGSALGVSAEALRKWRVRGVPGKFRLALVDQAEHEGFSLDRSAFDEPPGSRRDLANSSEAA